MSNNLVILFAKQSPRGWAWELQHDKQFQRSFGFRFTIPPTSLDFSSSSANCHIVLRLRRWMLFRRWMDRIKAFRHILLFCKDISPISWIKLLFFCKNTARRWLWHTFAIWILWISGLDCRFCGSLINLILVSILYRKNTNKDDILFHCKWLWILIISKATDTIKGWWTFNVLPK